MAKFIDLTCDEEWFEGEDEDFPFSQFTSLTDRVLADLDVTQSANQTVLSSVFPKCSISVRENTDVLAVALNQSFSSSELAGGLAIKQEDGSGMDSEGEMDSSQIGSSQQADGRDDGNGASRRDEEEQQQQQQRPEPVPAEVTSSKADPRNREKVFAKKTVPESDSDDEVRMDVGDGIEVVIKDIPTTKEKSKQNGRHHDDPAGDDDGSNGKKKEQRSSGVGAEKTVTFDFSGIDIEKHVKSSGEVLRLEQLSIAAQVTKSVEAICSRKEEDTGLLTKNGEVGFMRHDFPAASADVLRDSVPNSISAEKDFVSVRELAIPGQTTRRTVPGGIVNFILVQYTAGRWSAAPMSVWEQVTNTLEARIIRRHKDLRYILKQTSRWKGCGSYGLLAADTSAMERWRDLIPVLSSTLNTFPRDGLLMSEEVSVMLMTDLVTYDVECLPASLFDRNTTLAGSVRITCSKKYGTNDFTSMQVSKDGWRLVYLEGDALFMQSLSQHTVTDRFQVGCGKVTIRGGIRKPSFLRRGFAAMPWNPRKWVKSQSFPLLRTLSPIPLAAASSVPSGGGGIIRSKSTPSTSSAVLNNTDVTMQKVPSKPRTRSERLKLQKEKKKAFLAKKNAG